MDDLAKQLHEKATRGLSLSAAEQTLLNEWYSRKDQAESAELAAGSPDRSLPNLRAQLGNELAKLQQVSGRIQTLVAENDAVRTEIAGLQQQVTAKRTAQPA